MQMLPGSHLVLGLTGDVVLGGHILRCDACTTLHESGHNTATAILGLTGDAVLG